MAGRFICGHEQRRAKISVHEQLKGIDFVEVSKDEHTLSLHFVPTDPSTGLAKPPVPANISPSNIKITGGVRIRDIRVQGVLPGIDENIIDVQVADPLNLSSSVGDFSTYTLSLVGLDDLDPLLSTVEFSFKVGCSSNFDCKTEKACSQDLAEPPPIDYLCKDYASFRRLILDRLSVTMPDWIERNPGDVGIALVEVLAYVADHLSYYQDAVATEAYLGTARKRMSVRRHARLLDYPMHDGSNSRVFIAIKAGTNADGAYLPGSSATDLSKPKAVFLTQIDALGGQVELDLKGYTDAVRAGAQVFEAMEGIDLYTDLNEISFYTWGQDDCYLPQGSTRATLLDRITLSGERALGQLKPGRALIFEEVKNPYNGLKEDADPARKHVVRLIDVQFTRDMLYDELVVQIEWAGEDALPFDMCISSRSGGNLIDGVSKAYGNVILADHGRTVSETLSAPLDGVPYAPSLSQGPVSQQGRARDSLGRPVKDPDRRQALFEPGASASRALLWEMRDVLPAIMLYDEMVDQVWRPKRDLLGSGRFAPDFVLEVEDGGARLRFGDDVTGMMPSGSMMAVYRVGNGRAGNVGAGAISHVYSEVKGIEAVRNPLPAFGGTDPEPIEMVRIYAPQAFRIQERAVTEEDYARLAERHPEVQRAMATIRWTGSWHTVFITVDRMGNRAVDIDFERELTLFMERFRLAGMDVEIEGPSFVPLDIRLTICADGDHFRSNVLKDLYQAFSNRDLFGGERGFFHPDNFTFGDPVYLSRIIARAMEVPGVRYVDADEQNGNRFQRWDRLSAGQSEEGVIRMDRLEIARLDNDPSMPENGRIEFNVEGGL